MEHINLLGAEDVRSAGQNISSAAGDMNRAASSFDASVQDMKRFLDDWMMRLEEVLKPTE